MRAVVRPLLVCVPLVGLSGCSWLPWLGVNLVGTPIELGEKYCFDIELEVLAKRAWNTACAIHPDEHASPAYADGFHDGFVAYVKRGEPAAEPPTAPPFCYRYPVLRTPEQQKAIDEWFAGYRQGALVAQAQGWRNGVVIPVSRPPLEAPVVFTRELIPTPSADAPTSTRDYEELPLPRRDAEPLEHLPTPTPNPTLPPALPLLAPPAPAPEMPRVPLPAKENVWLGSPRSMPVADEPVWERSRDSVGTTPGTTPVQANNLNGTR